MKICYLELNRIIKNAELLDRNCIKVLGFNYFNLKPLIYSSVRLTNKFNSKLRLLIKLLKNICLYFLYLYIFFLFVMRLRSTILKNLKEKPLK